MYDSFDILKQVFFFLFFSEQPHKIFKQKSTQLPLGHGYTQYKGTIQYKHKIFITKQ